MMRQGSVHELEMQIEGTVPVDSIVETISDGMPRPAVRNSVVSEGDSLEGNSLEGLSLKAFYGSHKTAQGYAGGIGAVVGVVAATAVCVKGGGGCNHLRGLAHSGARVALSASNLRAISPIAYGIGFTAINSGSKIASLHAGGNLNVRNGLIAVGISSLEAVSDMYWMAGVDRAFILIHANFGGDFLLVPGVADYVGEARAMDEIYDGVQLKRWISRSSEIFPIVGEALLYSHVTGSNATVGEIVGSSLVYQGSIIGIASFRNTGHLYGRNIGDILTGWW
jgi:hypothetical protein